MSHMKRKFERYLAVACIVGTVFIAIVVASHAIDSQESGNPYPYSYPYPSDPLIYLPVIHKSTSIPTPTPTATPHPNLHQH